MYNILCCWRAQTTFSNLCGCKLLFFGKNFDIIYFHTLIGKISSELQMILPHNRPQKNQI